MSMKDISLGRRKASVARVRFVKGKGKIYQSIAESYFYLEKYKPAYAAIKKAMKDPKSRKSARGWVSFIKNTAQRKIVSI